ncbi:hypothetical protein J7K03_02410 [bacterium]|nr:hypothetical protein [bacterium]
MKIGGVIIWVVISLVLWWIVAFLLGLFGIALPLLVVPLFFLLSFLIIYFYLAPRNLYFTFVREGTAKAIVRGGEVAQMLIQWKGHTLDPETWEVIEGREPWHPFGGLRYYGLWPIYDVYIYDFKWTGVTEDGKVESHPKETLDYILLKEDVYWAKVEKAEDKNKLPLTLELLFTIQVVNPYKALFNIENWLEAVINRARAQTRNIITQKSYEHWIQDLASIGREITERIGKEEFEERYGIKIRKIEVKDINPPEEYRKATIAKYLAEREKDKIITEAEAEKARIERVYSTIQDFGDIGKLIRVCEAVEKSELAASLTIQAIPGIQEVLRGIFGKPPEAITQEEIREFKELLKKIQKNLQK